MLCRAFFELIDLQLTTPFELATEVIEYTPVVKFFFFGCLLLHEVEYGLHRPRLPVSKLATDDGIFAVCGLWVRLRRLLLLLLLFLLFLLLIFWLLFLNFG